MQLLRPEICLNQRERGLYCSMQFYLVGQFLGLYRMQLLLPDTCLIYLEQSLYLTIHILLFCPAVAIRLLSSCGYLKKLTRFSWDNSFLNDEIFSASFPLSTNFVGHDASSSSKKISRSFLLSNAVLYSISVIDFCCSGGI